jgi:putative tryptophan/tyrosine transport system substrate-binding protein
VRRTLTVVALVLAVACLPAQAQVARIGVLSPFIGPDSDFFEVLRGRLQELGYTEGRNAAYIYRASEEYDRLAQHAAEMVRLNVQVIVTAGAPGVRAAKSATDTIPIVIANVGDAVAQGFVANLARPGGNVTGLTSLNTELSAKRVDLLVEAVPSATHLVALREAVGDSSPVRASEAAARARGIRLEVMQVREADELGSAIAAASATRGTALLVIPGTLFASQLRRVVDLAASHRVPAIYPDSRYVRAGGLMSYGPNVPDLYRQAADYVDRILKGASPGSLPVGQPTKFELAVNLRAAQTLGLTLTPEVLLRADLVLR